MGELCDLYGVTEENLAIRRAFIGLDRDTIATLGSLRDWAGEHADAIAKQLTDNHFAFRATAEFFDAYARRHGMALSALRAGWEAAQAGHFRDIFAEAGKSRPFGVDYFERLLGVGALHNKINLPLKWYLGSYPTYSGIVHRFIADTLKDGKDAAARAIDTAFNYDIQAISDAFYYDTFATMGVDLARFRPPNAGKDLSDSVEEGAETSHRAREAFVEIGHAVESIGGHLREFTVTTADIASVAERSSATAEEVSSSTHETRTATDRVKLAVDEVAQTSAQLLELAGQFNVDGSGR